MKAVGLMKFGGPDVLEVMELPDPHPGSGEVPYSRACGDGKSDGLAGALGLPRRHARATATALYRGHGCRRRDRRTWVWR